MAAPDAIDRRGGSRVSARMPSRACWSSLVVAVVPVLVVACTGPGVGSSPVASPAASAAPTTPVTSASAPAGGGDQTPNAAEVTKCRDARAQRERDLAAAYAAAPRACTADADCANVSIGCGPCGAGAVEKGAVSAFTTTNAPLFEACHSPASLACDRLDPVPMPSCAAYRPVCEGGRCGAVPALGKK